MGPIGLLPKAKHLVVLVGIHNVYLQKTHLKHVLFQSVE